MHGDGARHKRRSNTPRDTVESATRNACLPSADFSPCSQFRSFFLAIHHFQLQDGFIELNVLLKLIGLAPSGGAAKSLIAEGAVRVGKAGSQEIETRTRRKLRAGDIVHLGDNEVRIIAASRAASQ